MFVSISDWVDSYELWDSTHTYLTSHASVICTTEKVLCILAAKRSKLKNRCLIILFIAGYVVSFQKRIMKGFWLQRDGNSLTQSPKLRVRICLCDGSQTTSDQRSAVARADPKKKKS